MKRMALWLSGSLIAAAMSTGGCVIVQGSGSNNNAGSAGDAGSSGSSATAGTAGSSAGSSGAGGTAGTAGTGGSASLSCDSDPSDECDVCFKTSCCDQIKACDDEAGCIDKYVAYSECFFPASGSEPSGYSTSLCKEKVGAVNNAAANLIDCYKSSCGTEANNKCGVEEVVTWEGMAAPFVETYCNGCHFDGFEQSGHSPLDANGNPKVTANFSCDTIWDDGWGSQAPTADHPNGAMGNPGWFEAMSLENVKSSADLIRCGVAEDLPKGCDAAKFPMAQRFPPVGTKVDGPHCFWMNDGETCAQPTAKERHQMESWLFDGEACGQSCDVTCPSP